MELFRGIMSETRGPSTSQKPIYSLVDLCLFFFFFFFSTSETKVKCCSLKITEVQYHTNNNYIVYSGFAVLWIFFFTSKGNQIQRYTSHKILSLKINSSGSLCVTSPSYLNIIILYLWPLRICKTWGIVFSCLFYMLYVLFFKFCHVPYNYKLPLENLWSVFIQFPIIFGQCIYLYFFFLAKLTA